MRKRFSRQRINTFWTILLSAALPCLLSTIVLALVFFPVINRSAKENDAAYEQNLLHAAANQLEMTVMSLEDSVAVVESNNWIHPLHLDLLANKQPNYSVRNTIMKELASACTRNSYRYYSFMLNGDNTLYSSTGVYSNYSDYHQYQDLQSQFFPSQTTEPAISTLIYDGNEHLLFQAPFRVVPEGQYRGQVNIIMKSSVLGEDLVRADC